VKIFYGIVFSEIAGQRQIEAPAKQDLAMQSGCDDCSTKTRPPNLLEILQKLPTCPPQAHLPRNAHSPANEQPSSDMNFSVIIINIYLSSSTI
jgi:hypothetical protein